MLIYKTIAQSAQLFRYLSSNCEYNEIHNIDETIVIHIITYMWVNAVIGNMSF